jgi:hypothetical protein
MEATERIELRRERDFGATIGVIFEFLRQNFLPLAKSLLFICGPLVLTGIILAGLAAQSSVSSFETYDPSMNPDEAFSSFASGFSVLFVIAWLLFAAGGLLAFLTVNAYVVRYVDEVDGPVTVSEVWDEAKSSLGRVLVAMILTVILVVIAYFVSFLAMMTIILIPFIWVGFVYLYVHLSILLPIVIAERSSFFDALPRAFELVKGKWWYTFGVQFVVGLIATVVIMLVMFASLMVFETGSLFDGGVPEPPSTIASILIGILFAVVYGLSIMLTLLTSIIVYYSLAEEKDGIGMADRISEIGADLEDSSAPTV